MTAAPEAHPPRSYTLIGEGGAAYSSRAKGTLGGHRRTRIFGRLDCPSALRAIARGGYVEHRVFFADAPTAVRAGYRPCAVCMPDAYRDWKAQADRKSAAAGTTRNPSRRTRRG